MPHGWGFFDGPSDLASVQAISAWGANAVRIPMNEDCWLNINGAPSAYSRAAYLVNYNIRLWLANAIAAYVAAVQATGLAPISPRQYPALPASRRAWGWTQAQCSSKAV